jgi:hypothetical protein
MAAREVLRQTTLDGRIVLEPHPDGGYVAHSFLLPLNIPDTPRVDRSGNASWLSLSLDATRAAGSR